MLVYVLCVVVLLSVFDFGSLSAQKQLYWRSNHAGLFSHYLQLKVMYDYAQKHNRSLIIEPISSKHYGDQIIDLCEFYDFSSTSITCSIIPESLECSKVMGDSTMRSSNEKICYSGPFLHKLTGGKSQREGIINAIPIDLPLKLHSKQLVGLSEFKKDVGIIDSEFTVAHWRRGDQLENTRCGSAFDSSVNCGDAKAFVAKVRQYTSDKVVYIATNEPQTSIQMDTIRAAGFLTLNSVVGVDSKHHQMDQLAVLAMEVTLMLEASTFLAWGISEIDDVVEFERKKTGRSYCTAHEHFVVKGGNLTFCHVDHETQKKAATVKVDHSQETKQLHSDEQQQMRHKLFSVPTDSPSVPSSNSGAVPMTIQASSNSGHKLRKTVFSNHTRLLFVAGLEGTGHHAVQAMFKVCNRTQRCEVSANISRAAMRYDFKAGINHGLFGAADAANTAAEVSVMEEAMRSLAVSPGDHLYFLGLGFVPGSGMLSYPNFNGRHKTLDHPDVFSLALIAESAGLDFRVLVLQRDAKDIIASTGKRGFGGALGPAGEPKILIDNAAALYSQLVLLDSAFIHCVNYDVLGNLTTQAKDEMSSFLHPITMKDELGVMLKEVIYSSTFRPAILKSEVETTPGLTAVSRRLVDVNNVTTSVGRGRKPKVMHVSAPQTEAQKASLDFLTEQLSSRLSLINGVCAQK